MKPTDAIARGARKEVDHIKRFVTSDRVGPFETADNIIKTARSTVKSAVGGTGLYGMRSGGMVNKVKPLKRIKRQTSALRSQVRRNLPKPLKKIGRY